MALPGASPAALRSRSDRGTGAARPLSGPVAREVPAFPAEPAQLPAAPASAPPSRPPPQPRNRASAARYLDVTHVRGSRPLFGRLGLPGLVVFEKKRSGWVAGPLRGGPERGPLRRVQKPHNALQAAKHRNQRGLSHGTVFPSAPPARFSPVACVCAQLRAGLLARGCPEEGQKKRTP